MQINFEDNKPVNNTTLLTAKSGTILKSIGFCSPVLGCTQFQEMLQYQYFQRKGGNRRDCKVNKIKILFTREGVEPLIWYSQELYGLQDSITGDLT